MEKRKYCETSYISYIITQSKVPECKTAIKTAYWSVYKRDLSIKYDGLFHGPLKTLITLKMPSTLIPELS